MNRRIVRTPQAAVDIAEIAEHLRREAGLAVALRFVDNAQSAFNLLAESPHIGAALGILKARHPAIRRWHIEGFDRYLILYRVVDSAIQIVRVLHGARDIETLLDTPG